MEDPNRRGHQGEEHYYNGGKLNGRLPFWRRYLWQIVTFVLLVLIVIFASVTVTLLIQRPQLVVVTSNPPPLRLTPTQVPTQLSPTPSVIVAEFPLNGRWFYKGIPGPVISTVSTSLTIDMSAYNRPFAYGSILDSSTIMVTFPDDGTYTGKLQLPGTIIWSNGTAWTRA